MKPLSSVCALRIWKISSCLRMPVAPPTFRSLAICVSFWMLMSFRSVMFRRLAVGSEAAGAGAGAVAVLVVGADVAGVADSGVAVAAGAGASCWSEDPLPPRAPGRLGLLGMNALR